MTNGCNDHANNNNDDNDRNYDLMVMIIAPTPCPAHYDPAHASKRQSFFFAYYRPSTLYSFLCVKKSKKLMRQKGRLARRHLQYCNTVICNIAGGRLARSQTFTIL